MGGAEALPMNSYLSLIRQVLDEGVTKKNRTGIATKTVVGAIFKHDMQQGFPLLTTKKVAFKSVKVELEFFISGRSDKNWLQERGCTIWDEWCNPSLIDPSISDEERKKKQKEENDLGPIYGVQWRNFSNDQAVKGVDQLKESIDKLKKNPDDRRIIVSAWNPMQLSQMALPPCHVLFHLTTLQGHLNLTWFQRSCDLMLGIPFNIASYALLLHLIAKTTNLKEGQLVGMLSDVHIYENHLDGAKLQLNRTPKKLPKLKTKENVNIFSWTHKDTKLVDYQHHEAIPFKVAV